MDEISLQFLCMKRGLQERVSSYQIERGPDDVEVDFRVGCFVDSFPNREGGFHLARFLRQAHTTRVQNTVSKRIFAVASFSLPHPSLPSLPSSFLLPLPPSHPSCLQLPSPPPCPHRFPSPTDPTLSRSFSRIRTGSSTLPSPRSRSLPVPVSTSLLETLLPPPLPRQSPQSQRRRRTIRRRRPPPPRNPLPPRKRVRILPSPLSFYSNPLSPESPAFIFSYFFFFRQSRSLHYNERPWKESSVI